MKSEEKVLDVLGIGVGPFNLSLAALLSSIPSIEAKFCDDKNKFKWHPELMFGDATMQTSFLKDLVTPIDPTNKYSFINYLVENGQFYHFMNTTRKTITRFEFQAYCQWVCNGLSENIDFDSRILGIRFSDSHFKIYKKNGEYKSKHLCIASGPKRNIPECAKSYLGENVFHAKSKNMLNLNLSNKRVLIVGGGQTGVETFRNALNEKWGKAKSIHLISGRQNLMPLDEGPFTNEIFTPEFVSNFHSLPQINKDNFTKNLLLASDGNTPDYLQELYNELYLDKFYNMKYCKYFISPMRWLSKIEKLNNSYDVTLNNNLNNSNEVANVDIIILATGFKTELPDFLTDLIPLIHTDNQGRPEVLKDYKLKTSLENNHIFAMNYSKHGHGIADPQTSLMSWRSAVIANSLLGVEHYKSAIPKTSFLNFFNNGV